MMKSLLILFAIISLCKTQRYMFPMYNMYKPGVCPEARGPCRVFCMQDGECPGNSKCCRTSCGGRLCLPPTTNEDSYGEEPIPANPFVACPKSTRWVCSKGCVSDKNCPRNKKCCPTKCGGAMCVKVE